MTDKEILDFLRHAQAGSHTPPPFNVEVALGAIVREMDAMQRQIDKHVPNSEVTH